MAAIQTVIGEESIPELRSIDRVAIDYVSRICTACDQVAQYQYEKILKGNPTTQQREENRKALKWIIRLAQLVFVVADDPEFPDRQMRKNLEAQIWRLKSFWRQIYEPISDAEAESVLREVFPDEPRA